MIHHPTLSPSALPMLEQCPCFERAEDVAALALEPRDFNPSYRDRGTELHLAFEHLFRGHELPKESVLTGVEREQIEWAVDKAKMLVSADHPVEIEQRLVLMDDDFNVVTYGTGDLVNGPQLFDLKTGDLHNYWLQMACYALMQMDRIGVDVTTIYLLFSRLRKIIELTINRDVAHARVMGVVQSVLDPDRRPKANPYCRWCKKIMTCEAVYKLQDGTETDRYEINDPIDLSDALVRARVLHEWCERVQAHARNFAMAGTDIPGFELKSRQGAREIMDVKRAYELSGLLPNEFIQLCSLPVGKLEAAIAVKEGMKPSAAQRAVNERLADVIARRSPTLSLVPTKPDELTEK
jgi:hypothetical protein